MLTRKPATHPDENTPQHKANLVRNLGRNDAEIAAIVRCNRSLRTLRDEIRQRHGEETLLDVGEGTIRLKTGELGGTACPTVVRMVPGVIVDADGYRKLIEDRMAEVMKERALRQADGNAGSDDADDANADDEANAAKQSDAADGDGATVINTIPPDEVPLDDPDHESDPTNPRTRTNLIRAFLLRLHLRRRLLNLLFRRMNRLARAMDGESAISSGLNGPTPPRYGDFRFLLDETQDEFRQFEAQFQKKVEARRNVEERRALRRNKELGLVKGDDDDDDGSAEDEVMADADTAEAKPEEVDGPTSSSSSPSDATIAKLILPQEDIDDLNVLMETDVGRDKMVTYQDLTKPLQALGGGGSGSPNKSKTPAAAKKSTPSSKMDAAVEKETAANTEAVAADIDAEATAEDADRAGQAEAGTKTEGPPSAIEVKAEATEENNGVANDGTSDTPAVKADDKKADDEEEELPPLPELVPGKIRKIVTLPLASSDPGPEERDFASAKFTAAGGGGIGAFNRSMNSREREVEFNRWKTDVLAKVPEQPTFAELGLENRVFGLEARRKKAAEAAAAAAAANGGDKMEDDDDDKAADDDDAMDVDDEGKSRKRSADDADEGNEEEEENEGDDNGADKSKEEAGKEKIKRPDIFKKKKLISLAAAPSFHMQDQHRVREVHKELLVRSRYEKTQKMVDEANAAYNKAYAVSTEVHNRKNQQTNELNMQSARVRMVENSANATHQATTNAQRALWQKAYEQWCSRRMKAGLAVPPMPIEQQAPATAAASQNGNTAATPTSGADTRPSAVNGTPLTAAKSSDSAATEEEREAASALGAVVDKVAKEEGGEKKEPVYNDPSVLENVPAEAENFPAFTVPPMNADLAAALAKERQKEAALRKQVTEDTVKLNAAEEERKKAWRQMLKLKGELQTAQAGGSAGSGSRSQRRRPPASRRAPAPAPAAATYRAPAPAARAPAAAATTAYAGHSAVYGQAQQVQQNYAHSQAAMAAYQAHASAAGAARAPAAPANYYGYGYPQQQQQQYVPTQQTSRPGMPTAPTGTMAMAAAAGAAATAPTAAAAVQQPPQQQQAPTQVAQQALAAYQAQQPQAQIAAPAGAAAAASSTNSVTHQQRYSQEAIRNRTYGDGSVAPAVPPKRDDNGLFQRPSGRSRKGMDWDAVHGVWRPSLGGDVS